MVVTEFEKKTFNDVLVSYNYNDEKEREYLFSIYQDVLNGIENVMLEAKSNYKFTPINRFVVTLYIINEYKYMLYQNVDKTKEEIFENEEFGDILSSVCADKYLTNEQLNYKDSAFLNRFNPPISTMELYLNFILRSLEKIQCKDKKDILIKDLLTKAFKMGKCIDSLLIDGFETEAFSTWRTLHENECILITLIKNGEETFNEYFRHITYNLGYRGQYGSKEDTDKLFEEIKEKMKQHDLKSKDTKKFIEYGYLYSIKNFDELTNFKLNFRDGVEDAAGLRRYSKVYEMASEITHSSPLLIYSNRSYFFNVTLINLYESFFRLESIFNPFYKAYISKVEYERYVLLKKLYMSQLTSIYQIILKEFNKSLQSSKKEENNWVLQGF